MPMIILLNLVENAPPPLIELQEIQAAFKSLLLLSQSGWDSLREIDKGDEINNEKKNGGMDQLNTVMQQWEKQLLN